MFCSKCGESNSPESGFCRKCGTPLSAEAPPVGQGAATRSRSQYAQASAQEDRPAGFWIRAVALLIDSILAQVCAMVLALPFGFAIGAAGGNGSEAAAAFVGAMVGFFVQWIWFTAAESSAWQASVGKKILGLKVTDSDGRRISFGRANGRYFSKILSALILCIGYIMVGFTEKKRGLHDMIAGTLVVKA